jgi:hypothetical protein
MKIHLALIPQPSEEEAPERWDGDTARFGRSGTLIPPAGSGEYRIDLLPPPRDVPGSEPPSPDESTSAPSTLPVPRRSPFEGSSAFEIATTKSTVPVPESVTRPAPPLPEADAFDDGDFTACRASSTGIRRAQNVGSTPSDEATDDSIATIVTRLG